MNKREDQYLKKRKEELNESECIIILDFAENYHYDVQDEIQGYHWNKDQCTVHLQSFTTEKDRN